MSERPTDQPEIQARRPASRVCRTAYMIGESQPVRCTIIGDQPLFYMDFEEEIPAEATVNEAEKAVTFDDKFAYAGIEKSLVALREKIALLDSLSMPERTDGALLMQFQENAAGLGKAADFTVTSEITLIATLRKSRLAAAFLDFAARFEMRFIFTAQEASAQYNKNSGNILLNPHLPLADQLLLSIRELRRLWQHRQGALLHPLNFPPDQAILINRAQIADLAVTMVRVGWELQLAGERHAWARLETSSLGDMARAFARESYADFRTLNNGVAACAVFETWFLSDRCRGEDRKLIQSMLADHQGTVFNADAPTQSVTRELVSVLGSMPFGKNYLTDHAGTIIADAVFTEVRDRSNANFLWFIKFERSFRETARDVPLTEQPMANHIASVEQKTESSPLTKPASVGKKAADQKDIHRKDKSRAGIQAPNVVDLSAFIGGAPQRTSSVGGAEILTFTQPPGV